MARRGLVAAVVAALCLVLLLVVLQDDGAPAGAGLLEALPEGRFPVEEPGFATSVSFEGSEHRLAARREAGNVCMDVTRVGVTGFGRCEPAVPDPVFFDQRGDMVAGGAWAVYGIAPEGAVSAQLRFCSGKTVEGQLLDITGLDRDLFFVEADLAESRAGSAFEPPALIVTGEGGEVLVRRRPPEYPSEC